MARTLLLLLVWAVFTWSLVTSAWAKPTVLIVQSQGVAPDEEGLEALDLPLDTYLAAELTERGQVTPIVWSQSDPEFRARLADGTLPEYIENPTTAEIRSVARALRPRYLLLITILRSENGIQPDVQLQEGGSWLELWRWGDQAKNSITEWRVEVGGLTDWDSTSATLARTWTDMLSEGPFRSLSTTVQLAPPDPDPGLGFGSPPEVAARPMTEDTREALAEADRLATAGEHAEAVLVLREAIDIAPEDPDLRAELADTFLTMEMWWQAAHEAALAAELAPGRVELRVLAARACLADADLEAARGHLNDALARGAKGPEVLAVQAELSMLEGDYGQAAEFYTRALDLEEALDSRLGRALARALQGDSEGARADLQAAGPVSDLAATYYRRAILLVDRALLGLVEDLVDLPRQLRLKPKDPELITQCAILEARVRALVTLVSGLEPPFQHQSSHPVRLRGMTMLAQAAAETLDFARLGDEDMSVEASISLSEALRSLPEARAAYQVELRFPLGGKPVGATGL